jgi:hypothetical protein
MTTTPQTSIRPTSLFVRWLDPWDGTLICSSHVPYDPRLAANGCYSKWIRRVKESAGRFASHILQDRIPRVAIIIRRATPSPDEAA